MARKTRKAESCFEILIAIPIAIVLFIPFFMISCISFVKFKRKYLKSPNAQRVIDIRRLWNTLIKGVIVCAIGIVIIYYSLVGSSPFIAISALIVILVADWCVARHLAVLYLGIVTDSGKDALFFPYDMQSYTVIDYITLRFFKDYCNVDSVPLSAITKISRGRGKDLYVHGTFGSRSIVMSNKQKRDECLAMIQSVTGKKRLLIAELEGF